jgi:hypothetical protein
VLGITKTKLNRAIIVNNIGRIIILGGVIVQWLLKDNLSTTTTL